MESSHLVRLPAELRIYIYELALTRAEPIIITSYPTPRRAKKKYVLGTSMYDREGWPHNPWALASTCRQLSQEATSIIYRCNHFRLDVECFAFEDRMSDSKKVRTLANRFLAAVRPEHDNIPKVLDVRFGLVDICDRVPVGSESLRDLRIVLRDLRGIAARLPGCDVRFLLSIGDMYRYSSEWKEWDEGRFCVPIHVQDVAASVNSYEAWIRQRTQTTPGQPGFRAEDIETFMGILGSLAKDLEVDVGVAGPSAQ
ncbi:hypothetical protein LTR15_006659 [Elasticomyces elasticus]|nr:hypothetical protein LTR15_006659 [Elasticomyces elasticus]